LRHLSPMLGTLSRHPASASRRAVGSNPLAMQRRDISLTHHACSPPPAHGPVPIYSAVVASTSASASSADCLSTSTSCGRPRDETRQAAACKYRPCCELGAEWTVQCRAKRDPTHRNLSSQQYLLQPYESSVLCKQRCVVQFIPANGVCVRRCLVIVAVSSLPVLNSHWLAS